MAPENDEPVYKCRLCSCMFRKLGSLNAHFTKAHSAFSSVRSPQQYFFSVKSLFDLFNGLCFFFTDNDLPKSNYRRNICRMPSRHFFRFIEQR